jgi:ABC-type phosphate transport system substrate-binding protein
VEVCICEVTGWRLRSGVFWVLIGALEGLIAPGSCIRRGFAVGVLLLIASVACAARDVAVIVNKSSPVKSLTASDIAKVANASLASWPGGGKVKLVLRDLDAPTMKIAVEKFFGVPSEKIKAIIAANPAYFVVVNSDEDVIRVVESVPGAMGLIDIYSITSGVNVVKINGKLPLEAGYALHGN